MRILLMFFLIIPLFSHSQYNYREDTSCYSSQHIAIQNDIKHRSFFETENKMDLFHTVYYLNRKHLLNVSAESDFIGSCCVAMFNNYRSALSADSTKHTFYDDEMTWDVQIYGLLDFYSSQTPMMDENYMPIEKVDAQGNIYFIYPAIDTTYYGFVSIPEIRIQERMLTQGDFNYDFLEETGMRIERFGFSAFDYSGKPELFWVDYKLFMIALEKSDLKTEDLPWYDMLFNRSYDGFRYKQTACDDPINRD